MDTLAIAPKGGIPYRLTTPATLYQDSITITQTYSFCPYVCNLFQIQGGSLVQYPIDIFNTWNYNNGDFSIRTGDKLLDGTMIFMQVQCISTLSLSQPTPVTSNFAVQFMDECRFSIVVPPNPEDQFIKLFFEHSFEFEPAVVKDSFGNIIDCGVPTTTLIGIEDKYPDIQIDYNTRIITVLGTDPVKHVDEFPLVFESCITLPKSGQTKCRRPSNVFKLIVTNPCTTSNIVTQPIPSILSAPILGMDSLSMNAAPTNWPWTEFITINGMEYYDYCQPVTLEIVFRNTNIIVPFVELRDEVGIDGVQKIMYLTPQVGDPIGQQYLTLNARLSIFPSDYVIEQVDFDVWITECITDLTFIGSPIPDIYWKWGYELTAFEATSFLQYQQAPECEYLITFEAFCHENDILTPLDDLEEVQFYPSSKTFTYEKCGPSSNGLDPECAGTPYTKVIPIRIVAYAGLTQIATEDTVEFNIIFEPDCTKDTIFFNIPVDFGVFNYFVSSTNPGELFLRPTYTQLIPECQVVCDLFENLTKWSSSNVNSIVTAFDPDTGFITVQSADLTLDDSKSLLVVECVSMESTVVSTIGEPDRRDGCDFEIEIYDDCRNAVLQPPVIDQYDTPVSLYSVDYAYF